MDKSTSPPLKYGPPVIEQEIKIDRRSFLLQVILPLVVGVLLIGAVIVLLWQGGVGTASSWADSSLIFLLLPLLCAGLIPLVLFAALFYGFLKLTAWLPSPLRKARGYIEQVHRYMLRGTDAAVKPLIVAKGAWAVVSAFFGGLASIVGFKDGETDD